MKVFVDTSVVLRVLFNERGILSEWSKLATATCSRLLLLEVTRVIDRKRVHDRLADELVADLHGVFAEMCRCLDVVDLNEAVWKRALAPFPTVIRSLDAIHLASAQLVREEVEDLCFATHDKQQTQAARALGFRVLG